MAENPFHSWWAAGFRALVPIIPPNAPISERSSIAKRLAAGRDDRGKVPGVRGPDGRWHGFDWMPYEADAADLDRWHAMGASVGLKMGADDVVAIDVDTLDETQAEIVAAHVRRLLGPLPERVGRWPKRSFFCRSPQVNYRLLEFGDPEARPRARVELLTRGKQSVVHGIHPVTGRPYEWTCGAPRLADLPVVAPALLGDLFSALAAALPNAGRVHETGAAAEVDQTSLRGDPVHVAAAIRALPNTPDTHPTRESMMAVGYALKGALPDDPALALDLFQEWAAKWHDDGRDPGRQDNDPEYVEAEWRRYRSPYRLGAGWLYEQAEALSGGAFDQTRVWFTPVEESSAFPLPGESAAGGAGGTPDRKADLYHLTTLDELESRPPPRWLVTRHVPDVGLGFLYSRPGAGKSFLMLSMCLAIAHGLPDWEGERIEGERGVVYIAAEGAFDFAERVAAWRHKHGVAKADVPFRIIETAVDFMDGDDVAKLIRTVAASGISPGLIVVDTVSRALPGADENLQKDMTRFVAACGRVLERFRCAVIGVHHAGKSGDMRGSTVLLGAGDFVFRLDREPGATAGRLHCEKMKAAPDGWDHAYAFDLVEFGPGRASLVPSRIAEADRGEAGVPASTTASVLTEMAAAWESGQPWAAHHRAGDRWAAKVMVRRFGMTVEGAKQMLALLLRAGSIVVDTADPKTHTKGYRVVHGGSIVHYECTTDDVFG